MSERKSDSIFKWVSSIALPVALAVSTYMVSSSIEESKLSSEYVKIAVSILGQKTYENSDDVDGQEALRSWAIRVLNSNSSVKMTKREQDAFKNNRLEYPYFSDVDIEAFKRAVEGIKALNLKVQDDK